MRKILQVESTLTDRYQTTIPEAVRDSLHLSKRDKITFTVEANGKVTLSRATENDPAIGNFLSLLAKDIKNNPAHIHSLSPTLLNRAQKLVADVDVDLDAPLDEKDE